MEENHNNICSRKENATYENLSTGISITTKCFFEKIFISDFKYPNDDIFQPIVNQLFNQAAPAYLYTSFHANPSRNIREVF